MTTTLRRSCSMFGTSVRLLVKVPTLCLFPVLGGVLVLLLIGSFCGALFLVVVLGVRVAEARAVIRSAVVIGIPAGLFVYLVCAAIVTFLNGALTSGAIMVLRGSRVHLMEAVRIAWRRKGMLLRWALYSSTVSLLVETVGGTSLLGRGLAEAGGVGWDVVTYLVPSVIIVEGPCTIREAVRRSAELLRKTWGEQLAARVGIGLALGVAVLVALIFFVGPLVLWIAIGDPRTRRTVALVAVGVVGAIFGVSLFIGACIKCVYGSVLYISASGSTGPAGGARTEAAGSSP